MTYHQRQTSTDPHVNQVYDLIIEKVVEELTPKLEEEGIDTGVLHSIRQLWKEKLQISSEAGAYGGVGGSGQPRASAGVSDYPGFGYHGGIGVDALGVRHGHAQEYQQQAGLRLKSETAGLPQTDGYADPEKDLQSQAKCSIRRLPISCPAAAANRRLPRKGDEVVLTLSAGLDSTEQLIGEGQAYSDVGFAFNQLDGIGGGPKRRKTDNDGGYEEEPDDDDGEGDGNEEDLNSDDDDDDDDIERTTDHIILCQYDKVTRQKQKWKAQFKDGMMRLKGRDFLFKKGSADMNFQK